MKKLPLSLFALVVASVTSVAVHAADIKGDAKAGETKNAMCIGCHGIVGYQASFPEIHRVPKISGQSAGYITAALNGYKKGDRKHGSMRALAESLSDQDIADLAAFYSTNGAVDGAPALGDAPAATGRAAELLAEGKCDTCHGKNMSTPTDGTIPKIAGQHSDYLLVALKSYKAKNNAHIGRNSASMVPVVEKLKNSELKQLANYLSSLPTELKTVPEHRFR